MARLSPSTLLMLASTIMFAYAVESQVNEASEAPGHVIDAAPMQPTWSEDSRFKEVHSDDVAEGEVVAEAADSPRFASRGQQTHAEAGPGASMGEPAIPSEEQIAEQRQSQMKAALADLKDEIVMTVHQIKDEKKWVHDVFKIVEEYNQKIKRVAGNVKYLQKKIQKLLLKKKQIENMILQNKLTAKLKEATKDLRVLNNALENVGTKKQKFEQSKNDVKGTIQSIKQQIEKLQNGGEGE
eukprot:jgi/Bigna1/90118/estExt_fgenesh1_pg.C_620130